MQCEQFDKRVTCTTSVCFTIVTQFGQMLFQEGFYLCFLARRDYFTHFAPSQSVGGAKTGDPREKPPDHPQADFGVSHIGSTHGCRHRKDSHQLDYRVYKLGIGLIRKTSVFNIEAGHCRKQVALFALTCRLFILCIMGLSRFWLNMADKEIKIHRQVIRINPMIQRAKNDRSVHCRKQVAFSALTCRFSLFALWNLADFG